MHGLSRSPHAAAAQPAPRVAQQPAGLSFRRDAGGWVIVLSILWWSIWYQNLPWSLAGFAAAGPTMTANYGDRVIKVCMILFSAYVIVARWSVTRGALRHVNVGLVALLVLCPLSAVWSIDSAATLLRFTSLMALVLTCFAISVGAWHRHRFQQLANWPLMLVLISSIIIGIIWPDQIAEIGTDVSQRNAWHGITHGKNEFGMMSSMAAIICINAWLAREGRTVWAILGSITAVTCLLLSRSNTSLFATITAVGCMVLVMRVPVIRQRFSTPVVVSIASIIFLYGMVVQNVLPGVNTLLGPIASLAGKDTTFSARTIIWTVIKEHIQGAPYLGTGYGAYWVGPFETSPSYVFVPMMFFYPTEAHNGYLDIVNDLGLLGLACLVLFLCWYIRLALQLIRFDRSQAALYLGILFMEMVINMSESDLFSRTSTFAILLLAVTCLSRELLEVRRSGRHG
jgi:exopolysaccharide production protein ExoQ